MLSSKRAKGRGRSAKSEKPFPKTLPGAVCASYVKCSKPNCKCARGLLHGPYYHRYLWSRGRVIKEYIPLSKVEEVRAACDRYRSIQSELRADNQQFKMLLSMLKTKIKELSL